MTECGLCAEDAETAKIQPIGLYEHWYHCNFRDDEYSTHYFSITHRVQLDKDILTKINIGDTQHDDYWLTEEQLMQTSDVHPYTKYYFYKDPPNLVL